MNKLSTPFFLVSTFFSMILISSPTYALVDCTLNGEHVDTNNGAMTEGKSGLVRCKNRDSGKLEREEELNNGNYEGVVRYFREGRLISEFHRNEHSNKHGLSRTFNKSGQLIKEETYDDGSTVGLSRFWSASGKLERITFFEKKNSRQVASVEWNDDGSLYQLQCGPKPVFKAEFNDKKYCGHSGKPGTVDLFSSADVLSSRSVYKAGKKIKYTTFWDDGSTVASELETTDKKKIKRKFSNAGIKLQEEEWVFSGGGTYPKRKLVFHETGPLENEKRWTIIDGYQSPTLDASFYLNGQPRHREKYTVKGSTLMTDAKGYHDNGKLSFNGNYIQENRKRQLPDGVHSYFNEQGVLVGESYYDGEGRITREKKMSADGSIISDDEVFADGSRKAYTK